MLCQVSALVTIEYYAKKEHFPGFGRPFAFNADILLRYISRIPTVVFGSSEIPCPAILFEIKFIYPLSAIGLAVT